MALAQTPGGHFWAGSEDGPARFDEPRFGILLLLSSAGTAQEEQAASWRFQKSPPFQRTPMFYAFCGFLAATMAWAVHRCSLQKIWNQNAILAERNRIAQEIHDSVGQGLTGIVLQLQAATIHPGKAMPGDSVLQTLDLATTTLAETRRALMDLRPGALEVGTLTESIRQLVSKLVVPEGMAMTFQVEGIPWPLALAEQHQLYRIAEESLTNAIRHSGGDRVEVFMEWSRFHMMICIRDNGRGLLADRKGREAGTQGLRGLFERAQLLGCRLRIKTTQGVETEVRIVVPRCPGRMFRWKGGAP